VRLLRLGVLRPGGLERQLRPPLPLVFDEAAATSAGARLDAGRVVSAAAPRGEAQLGFSLLSACC